MATEDCALPPGFTWTPRTLESTRSPSVHGWSTEVRFDLFLLETYNEKPHKRFDGHEERLNIFVTQDADELSMHLAAAHGFDGFGHLTTKAHRFDMVFPLEPMTVGTKKDMAKPGTVFFTCASDWAPLLHSPGVPILGCLLAAKWGETLALNPVRAHGLLYQDGIPRETSAPPVPPTVYDAAKLPEGAFINAEGRLTFPDGTCIVPYSKDHFSSEYEYTASLA